MWAAPGDGFKIVVALCVRGPKTTPRSSDLLGRLIGLSIWLLLMTKIYYSENLQSYISKEKLCMEQSPVESQRTCLILPMSCDKYMWHYLSVKLFRNSVPGLFIGGWSHRHSLPSTQQNSRLPKGKQVFSINHIICIHSFSCSHKLQLATFISTGNCGNPLKIQVPRYQPRANLIDRMS